MRIKSLLFLSVIAFSFLGCKKKPLACFSVSSSSVYAGISVDFASCSEKAKGFLIRKTTLKDYRWDFGDATLGSGESTSHTYSVAGTYVVTLEVTDEKGRAGSTTQTITVAPFPSPVYGDATFWKSGTPAYNNIAVLVGGSYGANITADVPAGPPFCAYPGCANFNIPIGTYNYVATEQSPGTNTWSGTVTITASGCQIIQLP